MPCIRRSTDVHTVSSRILNTTCSRPRKTSRSRRLLGTAASPCLWGDAQAYQTREGRKGVIRVFSPAGKPALQSYAGIRASPYRDSAHAHALPVCLRGTSLPLKQNRCPPGKDSGGLKDSLRAACAQKVWIWQVSFTKSFRI